MMDKITKEILKIEREEKERMDEIMHGMAQNNDKKVKTQKRENGEGKGKENSDVGDNGEEREEGKLEKVEVENSGFKDGKRKKRSRVNKVINKKNK